MNNYFYFTSYQLLHIHIKRVLFYFLFYTYRKHKNFHTKLACPRRQTHACIRKERTGDTQTNSNTLDLGSFVQSSKADDGHTHAIWSQPNSGLQKGSWKEQWSCSLETGEALSPISSQQATTRITAVAGPLQYIIQHGPGRSEPKWAQHGAHTDDDNDVEINVLGCRVDILGTNWPVRKHGSMLLYVHGNHKAR